MTMRALGQALHKSPVRISHHEYIKDCLLFGTRQPPLIYALGVGKRMQTTFF